MSASALEDVLYAMGGSARALSHTNPHAALVSGFFQCSQADTALKENRWGAAAEMFDQAAELLYPIFCANPGNGKLQETLERALQFLAAYSLMPQSHPFFHPWSTYIDRYARVSAYRGQEGKGLESRTLVQ